VQHPKDGQVPALQELGLLLSLAKVMVEQSFILIGAKGKRTNSYSTSFTEKKSLSRLRSVACSPGNDWTMRERL
jgi:hypothetical protein